jgi:HK97 family phage major capsid protein
MQLRDLTYAQFRALHPLVAGGDHFARIEDVLTPQVRQLNSQISEATRRVGDLRHEFEQRREELERAGQTVLQDRDHPTYQATLGASQALEEAVRELERLRSTRDGLIEISTGHAPGSVNGPQDGDVEVTRPGSARGILRGSLGRDDPATLELTQRPGAWLSAALATGARSVSNLPEDLRMQATMTVGASGTTTQTSSGVIDVLPPRPVTAAVVDLLAPVSVVAAAGFTVLEIETSEVKVPRFTALPVSGWVAELGAIPKADTGLEMLTVKPGKVGIRQDLSLELFEDLSPAALALAQTQLLRSVALKFDQGLLAGSGTEPEPRGIFNTPGIGAVSGPLTSLAVFADAIATLLAGNARPGGVFMHPLDVGKLVKLVEASGSNKPLWQAAINGPTGLLLPFWEVPIYPTTGLAQGQALMVDPGTILIVVRRHADVAFDPFADLDHAAVGFRVLARAHPVVGQPAGSVAITFTP